MDWNIVVAVLGGLGGGAGIDRLVRRFRPPEPPSVREYRNTALDLIEIRRELARHSSYFVTSAGTLADIEGAIQAQSRKLDSRLDAHDERLDDHRERISDLEEFRRRIEERERPK